jgi:hypothetical protein
MAHVWNQATPDRRYGVTLQASDEGALSGTLIFEGTTYTVVGGWDAQFSLPGRNFSAFSLSGYITQSTDAPSFIASAGYMFGSSEAPVGMEILMDVSSSANGSVLQFRGTLAPV